MLRNYDISSQDLIGTLEAIMSFDIIIRHDSKDQRVSLPRLRRVNEIPLGELTVSIFRHTYPRELLVTLDREGFVREEVSPGIHRIIGSPCLPTQIVVTSQLPEGSYPALKILYKHAKKSDVLAFLDSLNKLQDPSFLHYSHAVLEVSMSANLSLYETIKEENGMSAVEQVFKEQFDLARTEGREEGGVLAYAQVVKQGFMNIAQAAKMLGMSAAQFTSRAAELGYPLA